MYVRIVSSSRPTVETKYPLAQNLWPRKLRSLRSTFCAIQIELFPFKYPITSATEYFGDIDIRICTWSGIRCPSSMPGKLVKYSAEVPPDLPKQQLLAVLRREHDVVLTLPCRVVQMI